MSEINENNKRPHEDDIDITSLYNDPQELVNAVISVLTTPEATTNVSETYANDKNQATEVQAYAKISGNNWTYYVKTLSIAIGRNTDQQEEKEQIQIDLGPAKVVSRTHATIAYNLNTRLWELLVSGRNGAKVDGSKVSCGPQAVPAPLRSGSVVDIGGTQMMFILPDSQPVVAPEILALMSSKIPRPAIKKVGTTGVYALQKVTKQSTDSNNEPNSDTFVINNNLKGFQIFSQDHSNNTDIITSKGFDNDLSTEDAKDIKPPYSYATMITQAILSNPEGVLSLSEIYGWIANHYAFYRFSKTGWQNSIRHNLSLNKAFEKVPRRANEPGKGMKWQISDSYKADFLKKVETGSLSKVRRGSSVSRQLQLHLATHHELPQSQERTSVPQTPSQLKVHNQMPPPQQYAYAQYPQQPSGVHTNGNLHYLGTPQQQFTPSPLYHSTSPQHQYNKPPNQNYPISQEPSPERQQQNNDLKQFAVSLNSIRPQSHESNISSDRTEVVQSSQVVSDNPRLSSPLKKQMESRSDKLSLPPVPPQFDEHRRSKSPEHHPLGLTKSPSKVYRGTPTESYTPERGLSKKTLDNIRNDAIQSSPPPTLWNFVQFSTPVKGEKGSSKSNGGVSPIKNLISESSMNQVVDGKENIQDLSNVDLAKGFQK